MENCMFPMEFLRVTQKSGVGSHNGSKAIDFGGRDTGKDKVYAPFSGTIIRERTKANGEMYLQSDAPVRFADGSEGYCVVTFIHDSTFNYPTGTHVIQGQYIYDEGGMGGGNPYKFGNHLHMEVSKGKVAAQQVQNGKYWNGSPVYVTRGQMNIFDAMMLGNDVVIMNDGGYKWKKRSDVEGAETSTIVASGNIYVVKSGDSWWRIAEQQLGSGTKMYALAKANGKTISSALKPGDKLTLEV